MIKKLINNYRQNKIYLKEYVFSNNNDSFLKYLINFNYILKGFANLINEIFIFFNAYFISFFFYNKKKFLIADKKLKNKKCYIIANGPSSKNLDPKKFIDGDVLVMNLFSKNKLSKKFNIKYYFFLDDRLFIPKDDSKIKFQNKLLTYQKKIFKEIKNNVNECTFVFPYPASYDYVEKYFLPILKKVKYINLLNFEIADYIPSYLNIKMGVPNSFNILPHVICCAILKGYKKIYIYGAEQDLYIKKDSFSVGRNQKNINIEELIFAENQKEYLKNLRYSKKNKSHQIRFENSNYVSIWSTLRILKSHRNLNIFSKKKGVRIYNKTKAGILDSYD
jgi:hypothetical protein